jgi:hypothetical protein
MKDITPKLGTGVTRPVDRDAYEVENPEIQKTLRDVGSRIGHALPEGWGFLLLLFDYLTTPKGGATFYISSADREDVLNLADEWLSKAKPGRPRKRGTTSGDELNPDNEVVKGVHDHWHKLAALLLLKLANGDAANARVTFSSSDVLALARTPMAVGVKDDADGLTLWLTSEDEAIRLIQSGEAALTPSATQEEKLRYETN